MKYNLDWLYFLVVKMILKYTERERKRDERRITVFLAI